MNTAYASRRKVTSNIYQNLKKLQHIISVSYQGGENMAIIRLKQPAFPGVGFSGERFGKNLNEMNRLFQNFFGKDLTAAPSNVFPPVNIYQDKANLYLTAELPGMETSDVSIDIEQNSIQIRGERKIENENEKLFYHRRERESGSFSRKLEFKSKIDTDKVSAGLKDGILKVTMPKAQESQPKKITVKPE
jgi:HSP20 family protein